MIKKAWLVLLWLILGLALLCVFSAGASSYSLIADPDTVTTEKGLVAYYDFNQGRSTLLKDLSGNGNNGTIYKAVWRRAGSGYALWFDGINSYVDCGNRSSLDIGGPISLTAWVSPEQQEGQNFPALLGKSMESYQIRYYENSQCIWYINSPGHHVHGPGVLPDAWSHIAATFDFGTLKFYINGKLVAEEASRMTSLNRDSPYRHFIIGATSRDMAAANPKDRVSERFRGFIDEVNVYNRALSGDEILAQYHSNTENRNAMFELECVPVTSGERIQMGQISVIAGPDGEIQVNNGRSFCIIESTYSYPGDTIGFNPLGRMPEVAEKGWKPKVRKVNDATLAIEASGEWYSLVRTIRLANNRVELEDTLTNQKNEPVGVMIASSIVTPERMANSQVVTTADNPSVFFSQSDGDFGFLAEDDIGRLQFEAMVVLNTATIRHTNFALNVGKTYTFLYALYPLKPTGDVLSFINRIRQDWKTNFTIEGPFDWLDVYSPLMADRNALKKHIERRNLKVVVLLPWIDYFGSHFARILSREEYKSALQAAARMIREVAPSIKILGAIESDWVTIYPDKIRDGQLIMAGSPETTRVIDGANLPWRDSVKRDQAGRLAIDRYQRAGQELFALSVYPSSDNYQHKFMLSQAQYILDEVMLDGIYVDEFNQAWDEAIRSYEGWDGVSVDIDPATGRILSQFVNCSLVGIKPRVELIQFVLSRNKIMFANTYATSTEEQTLPVFRFWEMEKFLKLISVEAGKEPPRVPEMCQGVLGSPLGLGVQVVPMTPLAEGLMLGMMSYLRHGLLYCHYWYPDLPETGPGSGEYGPINHMFPITPLELHKGWIKGKERIIGCVSFETQWDKTETPKVLCFDLNGREASSAGKSQVVGRPGNWQIKVMPDDWKEFIVLE
jgi:hypothetical protein